jgi:hypothetical protein
MAGTSNFGSWDGHWKMGFLCEGLTFESMPVESIWHVFLLGKCSAPPTITGGVLQVRPPVPVQTAIRVCWKLFFWPALWLGPRNSAMRSALKIMPSWPPQLSIKHGYSSWEILFKRKFDGKTTVSIGDCTDNNCGYSLWLLLLLSLAAILVV